MPYAITLRFDEATAPPVTAMWRGLAARGASDDAARLGYAPHITLAVLPDTADTARLLDAASDLARQAGPLDLSFPGVGFFPGTPAVMFLAPAPTRALLAWHDALLTRLAGETIDPHYQPGHWVPHVTLAKDLTHPAAAFAVLDPWPLPVAARLDRLEVVRFRPVHVLASHLLAGAGIPETAG